MWPSLSWCLYPHLKCICICIEDCGREVKEANSFFLTSRPPAPFVPTLSLQHPLQTQKDTLFSSGLWTWKPQPKCEWQVAYLEPSAQVLLKCSCCRTTVENSRNTSTKVALPSVWHNNCNCTGSILCVCVCVWICIIFFMGNILRWKKKPFSAFSPTNSISPFILLWMGAGGGRRSSKKPKLSLWRRTKNQHKGKKCPQSL